MNHKGLGLQGLGCREPLSVVEQRSDHSIVKGLRSLVGSGVCRIACGARRLHVPPLLWLLVGPCEPEAMQRKGAASPTGHQAKHVVSFLARCCCALSDHPGGTAL